MDASKMEQLGQVVAEVDGESPSAQAEQQQQQQQLDDAERAARDWMVLPYTVGQALAMMAPELKRIYSEEACLAWGRTAAAMSDKHGWGSPSKAPEFAFAMSTLGFVVPTVVIVRGKLAELKAKREAETGKPDEPVAVAPVMPGGAGGGS